MTIREWFLANWPTLALLRLIYSGIRSDIADLKTNFGALTAAFNQANASANEIKQAAGLAKTAEDIQRTVLREVLPRLDDHTRRLQELQTGVGGLVGAMAQLQEGQRNLAGAMGQLQEGQRRVESEHQDLRKSLDAIGRATGARRE